MFLLTLLAACGSSDALPEPWSSLDLPITTSDVKEVAADELLAEVAGINSDVLRGKTLDALAKAGWSKTAEKPMFPGGPSATWLEKDTKTLVVVVAGKDPVTLHIMEK